MEEKRIYSLNLIAFVAMKTNLEPELHQDDKNKFYAIYPEVRGVAYAIKQWKQDRCNVEIHSFLREYKDLRDRINEMRGV